MNKTKTFGVLSFIALLGLGVASCFNPTGPGKGIGTGDSVRHGKRDTTIVPDTGRHHRWNPIDTMHNPIDTMHRWDTIKPPPPPPPPPDTGGLDSTLLDSLLHH